MHRFGKLFRKNYGDKAIKTIHSRLERQEEIEVKSLKKIIERKSLDYYGEKYSSLNPSRKRYIVDKSLSLYRKGARE